MSRKKDSSNIQKFSLPNTDAFKKIDSTNIYDKEVYVLLEKGQNLIRVNKLNEAYEIGKKLLTNYRNNYDVIMYVADIFRINRNHEEAIRLYEEGIKLKPFKLDAYFFLASVFLNMGNPSQAIKYCQICIEKDKNFNSIYSVYAVALYQNQNLTKAKKICEKAIKLDGLNAKLANTMAVINHGLNNYEDTEHYLIKALDFDKNDIHHLYNYGSFMKVINKKEKSISIFKDILSNIQNKDFKNIQGRNHEKEIILQTQAKAFQSLSEIAPEEISSKKINEIDDIIKDKNLDNYIKAFLCFGMWEIKSSTKDKNAFNYLNSANKAYREHIFKTRGWVEYPFEKIESNWKSSKEIFNDKFFSKKRARGHTSKQPIFILGMPRSGTTLVEQILGSHSRIDAAGELQEVYQLSNRIKSEYKNNFKKGIDEIQINKIQELGNIYLDNTKRFLSKKGNGLIDKMPGNYLHIGLIKFIFPNSKIIHVHRNPIDTCLSIYSKLFSHGHLYGYNLEDLGKRYNMYVELMNHWDKVLRNEIYHLKYENLIENLEDETKKLLNFCDYDFEESCLTFYKNPRPISTASVMQVRKKIYSTSIERWKLYSDQLKPLTNILDKKDDKF